MRLIARPPERRNGLSGAVVEGFQAVRGEWLCVMDGDLQHPPEVVPQMLAQAQTAGADMVVGSRKANLLGPMGLTLFRSFTSQSLTILARALFPRSLKDVSDPLTGLFLVRREKVLIERLRPNGFKILLEILVRCPHLRITEVPFDFATRHEGESKADVREGLRFFQHLLRLRLTAHQRPLGRYLAVSFSVLLLTLALLVGLVEGVGWSPLWAAVLASELSLLWSFWGKERFAFGDSGAGQMGGRFRHFWWVNQLALFGLKLPLMALLMGWRVHYALALLIALLVSAAVRYLLSDRWIWTRQLLIAPTHGDHFYNLHGLLTIAAPMPLPDLAYFAVPRVERVDVQLRLDRIGTPRQLPGGISYDEHLGRFGFALTLLAGNDFVEVVLSPIAEKVPHLVYANVLEPLLRWLLPQRGAALIRAGCVAGNEGATLFLAEQTADRQAAVLRSADYMAHDLTMLTADGRALAHPKPLIERRLLESHLLRSVGAVLRRMGLPTVTFNAYGQRLFPPRQQAIPPTADEMRVAAVTFLDGQTALDGEQTADLLQSYARDDLGFPLFAQLEAEIRPIQNLERQILVEGLAAVKGKK
ncbi:MAG: GtrA family protein [Chloroflexi bacterium]|nr:GtrA family protein [Chloroflexota bacterium]